MASTFNATCGMVCTELPGRSFLSRLPGRPWLGDIGLQVEGARSAAQPKWPVVQGAARLLGEPGIPLDLDLLASRWVLSGLQQTLTDRA
jgi:hypothetical protein